MNSILGAITFDFTGITDALGDLGTALVAAAAVVISGAIVVYGVVKSVMVAKRLFGRLLG
jgi:hypothetical protein